MEVSNLQKLNNDGYLYAPKIIMDPKNLYFPPPKDENNNNKTGALVYEGDEPKLIEEIDELDVPTSFSRYKYPSYHQVHKLIGKAIENILQIDLFPTYYYERCYWKNSVLVRHTDRPACEISISIQVSSNTKPWPIFFKKPNGEESSVTMNDGDGVIYKGIEIEHWRNRLDSKYNRFQRYIKKLRKIDDDTYHHQVFFHYVKAQGNYVHHAYDRG
tara:strand:- start:189 stop:833 length:645 start_codon:yes stop_codon:yes gene_type:complete